jgi:hypothetical protein
VTTVAEDRGRSLDALYAQLGLRTGASQTEVHAAYRKRIRACHPDYATSEADRVHRTRATARLNVAYAELRGRNARRIPEARSDPAEPPPRRVVAPAPLPLPRPSWRTLRAIFGALIGGIFASMATGDMPLTVSVLVGGTVFVLWAEQHGRC